MSNPTWGQDSNMTLPDQLMDDFDRAVKGQADINPFDVLHSIIADVLDSVRLAMSTPDYPDAGTPTYVEPDRRKAILTTVEDYIANHYGED